MFRDLPTLLAELMFVVNYIYSLMMLYAFQILPLCFVRSDEIPVLIVCQHRHGVGWVVVTARLNDTSG